MTHFKCLKLVFVSNSQPWKEQIKTKNTNKRHKTKRQQQRQQHVSLISHFKLTNPLYYFILRYTFERKRYSMIFYRVYWYDYFRPVRLISVLIFWTAKPCSCIILPLRFFFRNNLANWVPPPIFSPYQCDLQPFWACIWFFHSVSSSQ